MGASRGEPVSTQVSKLLRGRYLATVRPSLRILRLPTGLLGVTPCLAVSGVGDGRDAEATRFALAERAMELPHSGAQYVSAFVERP